MRDSRSRRWTLGVACAVAVAVLAAPLGCSPRAAQQSGHGQQASSERSQPRQGALLISVDTATQEEISQNTGHSSLVRVDADGERETVVAEGFSGASVNGDGRHYLYGVRDGSGKVTVHLRDDGAPGDEAVYSGDVVDFGWAGQDVVVVTGVLPEDTPGTDDSAFRHATLANARIVLLSEDGNREVAVPEGMRDFSVLQGDEGSVYFTGTGLAGQFGWAYGIWRLDRGSLDLTMVRDLGTTEEKPGQRLEVVEQVQYTGGRSGESTEPLVALMEQVMATDPLEPRWPTGAPRVYAREERMVVRRLSDMAELRSIPATPAYSPYADQPPQTIPLPPRRIAVGPMFDRYLQVSAVGKTTSEGYGVFEIDAQGRGTRLLDVPDKAGGLFGTPAVLGYANARGDIAYADAEDGVQRLRVLDRASGESRSIADFESPDGDVMLLGLVGVLEY